MRSWFARGWLLRPADHAALSFTRLGAFIDGVYAIAATLLVLEIHVPDDVEPGRLGQALGALTASYVAYVIGFLQMVTGWVQTRRLDTWLRGIDHYATLLVLATLALFALTPFTTAVLARAFDDTRDLASAVRLTSILLTATLLVWAALLLYVQYHDLFRRDLNRDTYTLYLRLGTVSWTVPALAWLLSHANAWLALALLVVLYLFALLPLEGHSDDYAGRDRPRWARRTASAPQPER